MAQSILKFFHVKKRQKKDIDDEPEEKPKSKPQEDPKVILRTNFLIIQKKTRR